jgi:hypothetical protein
MPTATKKDGTDLRTPPAPEMQTSTTVPTTDGAGWNTPMAGGDQIPRTAPDQPAPVMVEHHLAGEAAPVTQIGLGSAQLNPVGFLGTREEIQDELDRMAFAIRSFSLKAPDQVMRECAAYGARLTELAVLLHRVEATDRQYTRVRTQQVERWQNELAQQFKIASRIVEVQRQDLEMIR